jgi:hypothetical protein
MIFEQRPHPQLTKHRLHIDPAKAAEPTYQ